MREIKFRFRSNDGSVTTGPAGQYIVKAKLKGPENDFQEVLCDDTTVYTLGFIEMDDNKFKIRVKAIQKSGDNIESNEVHLKVSIVPDPSGNTYVYTMNIEIEPECNINIVEEFLRRTTIIIGAGMP